MAKQLDLHDARIKANGGDGGSGTNTFNDGGGGGGGRIKVFWGTTYSGNNILWNWYGGPGGFYGDWLAGDGGGAGSIGHWQQTYP